MASVRGIQLARDRVARRVNLGGSILMRRAIGLGERRMVPDPIVRAGMRRVFRRRLQVPEALDTERAGEAALRA